MIFSKKIYKLVSGKNLTLFSSNDKLEIFVFEKAVNKYVLDENSDERLTLETKDLCFNQVTKINDEFSMGAYGSSLSVIENEENKI